MSETVGVDFLLQSDSNTIAGKEDTTLKLERDSSELAPTQGTGTQYSRALTGLKDYSIDFDSLWLRNGSAIDGFEPTVTVDPSATNSPTLDFISEVTITLEINLIEFANTSHSEYLGRGVSTIRATCEITADVEASSFYTSDTASRLLVDAWDSSDGKADVEVALPGSNTKFDATWILPSVEFTTPAEDATEVSYTLESDGTITETISSNLDSGLDSIITEIFAADPSTLTALVSTTTSSDVEFTGPVLPSTLEITIPVDGAEEGVTTSGTLDAAGPITIQNTA
jgi:hypothetical protein